MVFPRREYSMLAIFVVVVFAVLALFRTPATALAFLGGALFSMLAGLFGMNAATQANVRAAEAARSRGQGEALSVAFTGGR